MKKMMILFGVLSFVIGAGIGVINAKINVPEEKSPASPDETPVVAEKASAPVSIDKKEKHTRLATFVERVDQFVILFIDGSDKTFIYDTSLREKIKDTKPDSEVTVTYYEKENGDLVITEFVSDEANEKDENDKIGVENRTWTFIALIDNNSALFDGQYEKNVNARFSDELLDKISSLSEGDKVEIGYNTNDYGQYVIETIE